MDRPHINCILKTYLLHRLQILLILFFHFLFVYASKILEYKLRLHPTILSNYFTNYTNTTGTGPQGAKDNDYPVTINIKTCKY